MLPPNAKPRELNPVPTALSIELALLSSNGVPILEETDDYYVYDERLLPQGAECQCADCGWLFGGLTGFDRHVSKGHADPLSLGLVPRFRSAAVV